MPGSSSDTNCFLLRSADMACGGLRTNLLLNNDVEKHVRGASKLRLVRKHIDALQHHFRNLQEPVEACQQNEAFALRQLQSTDSDKAIHEFFQGVSLVAARVLTLDVDASQEERWIDVGERGKVR